MDAVAALLQAFIVTVDAGVSQCDCDCVRPPGVLFADLALTSNVTRLDSFDRTIMVQRAAYIRSCFHLSA